MKKKKTSSQPNSNKDLNSNLGPINLEAPKIYRNSQSKQGGKANQTVNQKRTRQNKKRRLKNSVRKFILSFVLLIVLVSVGAALSLTVFFKTEQISVSGSGIYSEADIISASGIDIGDNLFLLDSNKIEERLTTTLPYIYDVKINRALPKTVKLTVTDAQASYSIKGEEETYILLDDNFKVLEANSSETPAGSVMITDAAVVNAQPGYPIEFEDEQTADRLSLISQAVKSTGMTQATSISSTDINKNYVVYDGRITFELGECEDLQNKIYRGLAACEQLNEGSSGIRGRLDLSGGKQSYFTAE